MMAYRAELQKEASGAGDEEEEDEDEAPELTKEEQEALEESRLDEQLK